MWVEFGLFGGFNLPILTGGGVEYFITSQLAAFVRARIGPDRSHDAPGRGHLRRLAGNRVPVLSPLSLRQRGEGRGEGLSTTKRRGRSSAATRSSSA